MAEAELPRHADKQLDQAGLHAALLVEQAMSALPTEPLRLRFAPLVGHAAELRDASGEALRKSAVATRAALGPGDGLADYVESHLAVALREALDDVLRILNRRAANRARPPRRADA
ncbi:MAG: hypothetical protein RL578_3 [Chloroflexota bacterium]|jgi:hypothetical protein